MERARRMAVELVVAFVVAVVMGVDVVLEAEDVDGLRKAWPYDFVGMFKLRAPLGRGEVGFERSGDWRFLGDDSAEGWAVESWVTVPNLPLRTGLVMLSSIISISCLNGTGASDSRRFERLSICQSGSVRRGFRGTMTSSVSKSESESESEDSEYSPNLGLGVAPCWRLFDGRPVGKVSESMLCGESISILLFCENCTAFLDMAFRLEIPFRSALPSSSIMMWLSASLWALWNVDLLGERAVVGVGAEAGDRA